MDNDEAYCPPQNLDEKVDAIQIGQRELWHEVQRLFSITLRKINTMATQLDHLTASVAKLSADVTAAIADIKDISDKLAAALANGDATAALAAADAAATQLDGVAASLEAALPAPAPAPATPSA